MEYNLQSKCNSEQTKKSPVFISYARSDRNLAPMIKPQKEKENKEIRTINKRGTIRGREGERRRGAEENQSIIIFLNEEGNVAALILLIRLSISPKRPNPRAI